MTVYIGVRVLQNDIAAEAATTLLAAATTTRATTKARANTLDEHDEKGTSFKFKKLI